MRSPSNPADAFPPTSRKLRKVYNSSKADVEGNVLTGLNHFAYPMGIIFDSAPIAIFCLVTGTKGQKWCSGLHGSNLFHPFCRREMRGSYY